ncbi:MAG: hypothetical protein JWM80_3871 [Cyanobacteria bacterium RYN_339]|nr:hypothetical protein [Cyanobacteria bacterium RYN_339]
MTPDSPCTVCARSGSLIAYDTYKHVWYECVACRNWSREKKARYPLEALAASGLRGLGLLAKPNKSDQELYSYYTGVLAEFEASGSRGKWAGELADLAKLLADNGHELAPGQRILDISGEPGFLAHDARQNGHEVAVTAFVPEVATAIARTLGFPAHAYDFAVGGLPAAVERNDFSWVLSRYGIGYCEDLGQFAREVHAVMASGGHVFVSYSPASHAVPLRWMFDDYAYLRQYTPDYVARTMQGAGLELARIIQMGSYAWDAGLGKPQRLFSAPYSWQRRFQGLPPYACQQHNVGLVFRKPAH